MYELKKAINVLGAYLTIECVIVALAIASFWEKVENVTRPMLAVQFLVSLTVVICFYW